LLADGIGRGQLPALFIFVERSGYGDLRVA